jgi:hypothetical protein
VELRDVTAFINEHINHAGIQSALTWFKALLLNSATDTLDTPELSPARVEIRRLHDHQVSPMAMLCSSAALYLFSSRFSVRLHDDERLNFAIAHALFALAPREYRPSLSTFSPTTGKPKKGYRVVGSPAKRALGTHLRSVLSILLHNIAGAIHQREEQQRAFTLSLAKGFPAAAAPSLSPSLSPNTTTSPNTTK